MNKPDAPLSATTPPDEAALLDALRDVLVPLARLAVARGLPYAAVDEIQRAAFVAAAHAAHPGLPEHRRVSRISAATGINRREVTRLTQTAAQAAPPPRSRASEVFAHWTSHPDYCDANGRARALPRQGAAPSFETLAQSVTRDMHPRSLLEELLRLGMAEHDAQSDTVRLSREAFVPQGDAARMLAFLGVNVGDHLSAAVANVLADGRQHFEQAIFADGLSDASLAALREQMSAQWKAMTADLVPRLQQLIADDARSGRLANNRLRIGLFSFQTPVAAEAPREKAAPKTARAKSHVSKHAAGSPASKED